MITFYHNPRCRKSREALQLLHDKGHKPEIVEYLKYPLNADQLGEIVEKLGISASELIRKGESEFKENFKGKDLTEQEWLDAMARFPKLMERPIAVKDQKAALGRPPENILSVL